MARPSKFTPKLAEEICALIAETPRGLEFICAQNSHLPTARTVHRWLAANETFCQSYMRAREMQADLLFDECLEIADNTARDTTSFEKNGMDIEIPDKEWILRSKLRVDTRMRMAGKLAPKKYGDKVEVDAKHDLSDPVKDLIAQLRAGR